MSPISDKLQALAAAATKLNTATDDLNEMIERVEDDLQRAGVGVEIWLDAQLMESEWEEEDATAVTIGEMPREFRQFWELGFARAPDKWRIAIRQMQAVRADRVAPYERQLRAPSPLASAPRQLRLEAVELLESLVEALTARAEELLRTVEVARQRVRS
jgi:hypothetical protein